MLCREVLGLWQLCAMLSARKGHGWMAVTCQTAFWTPSVVAGMGWCSVQKRRMDRWTLMNPVCVSHVSRSANMTNLENSGLQIWHDTAHDPVLLDVWNCEGFDLMPEVVVRRWSFLICPGEMRMIPLWPRPQFKKCSRRSRLSWVSR